MSNITTIKQQVYNIVKERIADGTYKHGQRLQEVDLAEDLKVSRSPVRETLKQLVLEGILEETPNKGVSLRTFSEKEIRDIYDLRLLLERYAVDHLSANTEFFPLKRLTDIRNYILEIDGRTIDYVIEPKINPHDAIIDATNNDYMIKVHRRASFCTMSYHNVLFDGENYNINLQHHLDIIDSLLDYDFNKTKEILTVHLLSSRDIICNHIRSISI